MAAPMRSVCIRRLPCFKTCFSSLRIVGGNQTAILCRLCSAASEPAWRQTSAAQSRDFKPRDHELRVRHSPSFRSRSSDELEEELEYDIDDGELVQLRRQHRDNTRAQTLVDHGKKFSDFPLSSWLLKRMESLGYHEPFRIQADTLPHTLNGRDVIGRALTGSGKTLAFSIPIVERIMRNDKTQPKRNPRAIVISPTRELCLQIHRSVQELNPSIRCLPIYGGESFYKQQKEISSGGVDIVCATPGRLGDHLEKRTLCLDDVEFLCLDEADHLLTPDFLVQIEGVLENTPRDKQIMLFSATMPSDIRNITRKYMRDAVYVDLSSEQKAPSSVTHLCMKVPRSYHVDTIFELLNEHKPERCIIFIRTKEITNSVALRLREAGLNASELHSGLTQARRSNVLSAFRTGQVSVLVATDVAARGLDVPEVDLVIQVEPPANGTDFYIHRSGRTGRAGREGVAVMIHSGTYDEKKAIREIERVVPLQHVSPPNYEQLQYNKMHNALKALREIPEAKVAQAQPLVEKVEVGEERRLLAAAIALLKDSELLGSVRREEQEFREHEPRKPRPHRHDRFHSSRRPARTDGGYRDYQSTRKYRGLYEEE